MLFSGSNGYLYQIPTLKNLLHLSKKKSISFTPVSMSTTLLLESASWCLLRQRIIQLRYLTLRYKCELTSPREQLPEKSVGQRQKERKSPARPEQTAGVMVQGQPSLKDSRQSQEGAPGSHPRGGNPPSIISERGSGTPCRIRRESSGQSVLASCFPGALV